MPSLTEIYGILIYMFGLKEDKCEIQAFVIKLSFLSFFLFKWMNRSSCFFLLIKHKTETVSSMPYLWPLTLDLCVGLKVQRGIYHKSVRHAKADDLLPKLFNIYNYINILCNNIFYFCRLMEVNCRLMNSCSLQQLHLRCEQWWWIVHHTMVHIVLRGP